MNPMMIKSGTYMGRHVNYAVGHVNITPEWWENDGHRFRPFRHPSA